MSMVPRMALSGANRTLQHRLEEAARETGVLLLVLTPIDFVLSIDKPFVRNWLLILFCLGIFFLGAALITEFRRHRAD